MCGVIALLLMFAGMFGIGSAFQTAETIFEPPTATVDMPQLISCKGQSFEEDIAQIRAIVGDTFAGEDWSEAVSGSEVELRTSMTWTNFQLGALGFLDYLHYDCGVTQAQIADYFSQDNIDIMLGNYRSFERTAVCEFMGKHLYEFDVVSTKGLSYKLRWWYWQETPTRVAMMQLTFPVTQQAALAEYAGALFPNFPTCAPAAG